MSVLSILNDIKPANENFINTPFEQWYNLPATSKGKVGEEITKEILSTAGLSVSEREDREHDMLVNGKKVEVKTAFMRPTNDYVIYGYDPTENPHYWALTLVSPSSITIYQLDRNAMANVYLGKSRKNIMATVTPSSLMDAGAQVIGSYVA